MTATFLYLSVIPMEKVLTVLAEAGNIKDDPTLVGKIEVSILRKEAPSQLVIVFAAMRMSKAG
jgi:hypothetical protein